MVASASSDAFSPFLRTSVYSVSPVVDLVLFFLDTGSFGFEPHGGISAALATFRIRDCADDAVAVDCDRHN